MPAAADASRSPAWLRAVERALQALRYGTVQLVVHEGQIVRIERVERIRLTEPSGSLTSSQGQPTVHTEGCLDERME